MKLSWGAGTVLGAVMLLALGCAVPLRETIFDRSEAAVQGIAFASPSNNPPSLSFQAGTTASQTVTIAFMPNTVTNKNVSWASKNGLVVISRTGPNTATVTPVVGTGAPVAGDKDIITATPDDGGTTLSKTCEVDFTGASTVPVTGIGLDQTALSVPSGSPATLKVTISPSGSSVQTVNWSIASTTSASATFSGGGTTATTSLNNDTVTIVGGTVGTGVTVTATLVDGSNTFTKTCNVTVANPVIPVASIAIDQGTGALLVGETQALTAAVLPQGASFPTLTWSSSNPAVVSVNATTGVVQAQNSAGGSALITATADGKSSAITITVEAPAQVPAIGAPASPGGFVYLGATMALDPVSKFPVIAYSDASGNGHVQMWQGSAWSTNMGLFNVGAVLVDSTLATNLALAVDSAGNPSVAYIASSNSAARMAQWSGIAWNALTAGGPASTTTSYLAMGIGQYHSINNANLSDVPYIAMVNNEFGPGKNNAGITVWDTTFSGGSWVSPTTGALQYAGASATSAWTSLVMNPKYDFTTNPGVDYTFVASLIGATNLTVYGIPSKAPLASVSASGASYVSLGLDPQGAFYVAYVDAGGTARLLSPSSTGTPLGASVPISAGTAQYVSLVLDPRPGMKVAYVSFRDGATGQASLWKWDNGTSGLLIADVSGAGAQVQGTKLVMSSNGHLYYMYETSGNVVVKDFAR